MKIIAILAAFACSGCAIIDGKDRISGSQFKIIDPGRFEYFAAVILDEDGEDPKAAPVGFERWLKDWLAENRMCPNGYRIDDVKAVRALGKSYNATYFGHCV